TRKQGSTLPPNSLSHVRSQVGCRNGSFAVCSASKAAMRGSMSRMLAGWPWVSEVPETVCKVRRLLGVRLSRLAATTAAAQPRKRAGRGGADGTFREGRHAVKITVRTGGGSTSGEVLTISRTDVLFDRKDEQ